MTNNRPNAGVLYRPDPYNPYGIGGLGVPPVKLKYTSGLPNPYTSTVPTQSNLPSGFVSTQEIAKPEYKIDPYKVQRENQLMLTQAGTTAMQGAKAIAEASKLAKSGTQIVSGLKTSGKAASSIGTAGTVANAAAGAAIGGASLAGSYFSNKWKQNTLEDENLHNFGIASALKSASDGAGIGTALGTVLPGIGNIMGAAAGAIGGFTFGLTKGLIQKNKILDQRTEEQKRIDAENERIRKQNRQNQIKARDQYNTNLLYAPKYQMGGNLQQPTYLDITNLKPEEQQLIITKVVDLYKKGEDVGKIASTYNLDPAVVGELLKAYEEKQKKRAMMPASFKKGGKLKAKSSCGCSGEIKFTKGGKMSKCKCGGKPMFKRGGELDLAKQNVILDGPSHDEYNNTGVKGDRGLPVVKMGKGGAEKIAEIESLELMINANSSQRIQELRKKAKAGDKKAIEELGRFLHEELEKNTYDYSNLMS